MPDRGPPAVPCNRAQLVPRLIAAVFISLFALSALPQEDHVIGPRIGDEQFIRALDLARPDLAAVRRAADSGDLVRAKAELVRHLKRRTQPRWRRLPRAN